MKKIIYLIVLILVSLSSVLCAQETSPNNVSIKEVDLPNDLKKLESERLKLISDMYGMMYEISGLFTELERSESLENLLSDAKEYHFNSINIDSLTVHEQQYIARLNDIKTQFILPNLIPKEGSNLKDLESMTVTEGFRRIIENKVQDVLKKTDQLSSIGAKVTELNNTSYVSQNFKKQISWSFAFLVGIVIVGFFIIANRDDQIRKSIFTGDAGLQFITIFSIIIAIILFGITEVLGGKEIAALIGGISGYILGRNSLKKQTIEEE